MFPDGYTEAPAGAVNRPARRAARAGHYPGERLLGRYILLQRLEARAGERFRARELSKGRDVTVYLVPQGSSGLAATAAGRSRVAAGAAHESLERVIEVKTLEPDQVVVVAETVHGAPASELTRARGPLLPNEAVSLVLPLCAGLLEARGRGVAHGDISPELVLIRANPLGEQSATLLGLSASASKHEVLPPEGGDVAGLALLITWLIAGRAPAEQADHDGRRLPDGARGNAPLAELLERALEPATAELLGLGGFARELSRWLDRAGRPASLPPPAPLAPRRIVAPLPAYTVAEDPTPMSPGSSRPRGRLGVGLGLAALALAVSVGTAAFVRLARERVVITIEAERPTPAVR